MNPVQSLPGALRLPYQVNNHLLTFNVKVPSPLVPEIECKSGPAQFGSAPTYDRYVFCPLYNFQYLFHFGIWKCLGQQCLKAEDVRD